MCGYPSALREKMLPCFSNVSRLFLVQPLQADCQPDTDLTSLTKPTLEIGACLLLLVCCVKSADASLHPQCQDSVPKLPTGARLSLHARVSEGGPGTNLTE